MIFLYILSLNKMTSCILELISSPNKVFKMIITARTVLSFGRVPWYLCQHDGYVFTTTTHGHTGERVKSRHNNMEKDWQLGMWCFGLIWPSSCL